jgi:hypothetical protein
MSEYQSLHFLTAISNIGASAKYSAIGDCRAKLEEMFDV